MHSTSLQDPTLLRSATSLLEYALDPVHWLPAGTRRASSAHLRVIGSMQVCATVDVTPTLETMLRISFRGPDVSPLTAIDLLEELVKGKFTFAPNTEWEVMIDARKWIHFSRRYTRLVLRA